MSTSDEFGSKPINFLLRKQAIPASIGIMVLSIYGIVDTIFVGNFVGSLGIAAITVVIPITFLISSIGMGIGIGGASVISRALGAKNAEKAGKTLGNQLTLTLSLGITFCILGYIFIEPLLSAFGAKGDILAPTIEYFSIILLGIPVLAYAMMSNNIIRAVGYPKVAMYIMIVPAVVNIILDPIFIIVLDMGIKGAAWATTISYIGSASYAAFFFIKGKSGIHLKMTDLLLDWKITSEIFAIGSVTFARQGIVSLLFLILNNSLYRYGGETSIAVYGIINRMMMVVNIPALGITQGSMPIIGYNFGAKSWKRVKLALKNSMLSGTLISSVIFALIMIFTPQIIRIFTNDSSLITETVPALRITFLATPLIALQLISSAYYQAIGKSIPALLLTLTKQGFFLIPLILILPHFYGLNGLWIAFPVADILATTVCMAYLFFDNKRVLLKNSQEVKTN
ncbi:MATE family efflux transporter [Marivirga sp. S37H4]|uniref:Multidrug export protein MepA n=1 Tax=Marivirga aurantiaca TaxID=2802615 RepID=A0A934X0J5_9BACT|nr:MATE family efflux transporter [Marivirga aurantiaca]MBK6266267.1 MATE family efflux transporter [Marivirga aurantiaca]